MVRSAPAVNTKGSVGCHCTAVAPTIAPPLAGPSLPPSLCPSLSSTLSVRCDDFEGNYEGVGEEVRVGGGVEDVEGSVICDAGKQGVRGMEVDSPDGSPVVLQRLVRLSTPIQVKPTHTTVEGGQEDMVTRRMNGHTRDGLKRRQAGA